MNLRPLAAKLGITIILLIVGVLTMSFIQDAGHGQKEEPTHTENAQDESWQTEVEKEEYNAGKKIIEHITDSHDWHILDYKDSEGHKHHVSIPLPVILYHDGKFHTFMSDKLWHGHVYKGFKLATEGPDKGKVVKVIEENLINPEIITKDEGEVDHLPLDLSITKNVLAIIISSILLIIIFVSIANRYKRREKQAPKGLQSLLEPLIVFLRDDVAKDSIGEKYERYMPYLLTLFFFIFFNNLFGLVPIFPGGANVTGNIAVTGVMAFFTFLITTFSGNKNYWQHIFNAPGVPWWLKFPVPLMPVIELIGMFTKPFVLMVRLFANITAGHIIILGFISLIFVFGNIYIGLGYGVSIVSIMFSLFMSLLELLVAFIQAYVFTLLSALYFGLASEEHH